MGENDNNNDKNKKPGGLNSTVIMLIIAVILTLIFWIQYNNYRTKGETEVAYSKFIQMVDSKEVGSVEVYSDKIYFEPKVSDTATENVVYYVVRLTDYELVDRLAKSGVEFKAIDEGGNVIFREILSWVIMIGAFYLVMMLFMRSMSKSGGGIMGVGKSGAKMYGMEKETGITFADVAGEEEAKESLTEMVDFLREPKRYLEIGAKLPRGALLVGPPGTGKTLLAKAVAGEAGVPFFSMSGSEFVEMYVGVGASRVRDLFKQATMKAPCIIFIDEIDAIGRSRDTRHMGGDSEREQTLNQLLSEMDGFDTEKGIIVLAATNRPEVLDKALLRPGRFDRRVIVEKPDLKGREDILKVHSKNVKLDETVDLHELAFATSGSAGADLANIINEAALMAVRKGRKLVSQNDLLESVEVVFAGKEKKDRILNAEEKSIVAYHESGHALLTVLQKNTMPVQKITIVPRTGGALGYVWQTPEEERYLQTKTEMEAHIVIAMGGRAAEAIKFPSVTTGASNDIEQATREARAMVTMYGMSDKFGMVQLEAVTGEYLDRRAVMQCSDETATKIDTEVKNIVNAAYEKAYRILKENEHVLDAIATYLIDHETISGKEFMDIFNQVTGKNIEIKMNEKGEVLSENSMFTSGFDVDLEKAADLKEAKKAQEKDADKEAKKKKNKEKKEAEKKAVEKKDVEKRVRVYSSEPANESVPDIKPETKPEPEQEAEKKTEQQSKSDNNENLPWN
ncbi:MAG: ATP-dependent zinc metalloprotease FtsH [Eubacterium sp.]|nr:ATP-dependent zinc metalloprotease FtsH [Eubacterium sp.]